MDCQWTLPRSGLTAASMLTITNTITRPKKKEKKGARPS
jgi:hypothetical protein